MQEYMSWQVVYSVPNMQMVHSASQTPAVVPLP